MYTYPVNVNPICTHVQCRWTLYVHMYNAGEPYMYTYPVKVNPICTHIQ